MRGRRCARDDAAAATAPKQWDPAEDTSRAKRNRSEMEVAWQDPADYAADFPEESSNEDPRDVTGL